MKILGTIGIIMLVSVVLISWGSLINDFENNYINTSISDAPAMNSSFIDTYAGRAEEINVTFSPLIEDIEDLSSQDGWLDTLGDGSTVFAKLVIGLPGMVLSLITSFGADLVDILNTIGIPTSLIFIAIVMLSMFALFKIINMFSNKDL